MARAYYTMFLPLVPIDLNSAQIPFFPRTIVENLNNKAKPPVWIGYSVFDIDDVAVRVNEDELRYRRLGIEWLEHRLETGIRVHQLDKRRGSAFLRSNVVRDDLRPSSIH